MAYQPKSYRKFLATSTAAALVATAVAPAVSAAELPFTDVSGHYTDAVDYLYSNGYINGTSATTYGTNNHIKRGDTAVIIANALELDTEAAASAGFTDVGRYAPAVNALFEEGIISGVTDTEFNPNGTLTRGAMAKILVEAYDIPMNVEDSGFKDAVGVFGDYIDALYAAEITSGKTADMFGTNDEITRGEFAVLLYKTIEKFGVVPAPEVVSVSAVDAETVKVNFNTVIEDVDHTNFAVSGGLTVVKAVLSSDGKSATLHLNNPLTSGAKYTVTATDIANSAGDVVDLKSEFVYTYDYGVTIELSKTSLDLGQSSDIIIKDENGKVVTPTSVEVASNNTNVVTYSGGKLVASSTNEGEAEVTIKATLSDDTVVVSTFNVTVEEVVPVVENQGFTLVNAMTAAPENTVEFGWVKKDTSLYNNGDSAVVAMYNTTGGNPDAAPVDFTDATVKSLNPTIATASVSGSDLTVTANSTGQTGKASFEITFADNTKKTISVDVLAEPEFKGLSVDATSVVLSDESNDTVGVESATTVDGVNETTLSFAYVDQYGKTISAPASSKVTISTNEEGITLTDNGDQTFTIAAQKGKVVPNAQVKVNYFAKATDATPAITKTVTVKVVDVDATKAPVAIDVLPTRSTIDAAKAQSSSLATVYEVDANGNRIGSATPTVAPLGSSLDEWLDLTGTTLGFDADAATLMSKGGEADLEVTAAGITVTETIAYTNSFVIPHKAMVNTKPVSIELESGDSITLEDILFGMIDAKQMLTDTIGGTDVYMAVDKNASNGGYKYNKPLVSVTDALGLSVDLGANVYGIPTTQVTGDVWDQGEFDIDADVVNTTDVTEAAGTVTLASGKDAGTFTIVLKSVKVTGDTHNDANLLAAPVSIDVTLAK